MLLALWSAYDFAPAVVQESPRGGGLGWFYNGFQEDKREKVEEFIEAYVDTLEAADVKEIEDISAQYFAPQKQIIAKNIVKQINAIDLLSSYEIQEAIRLAEIEYYANLARLREYDDENALLLLLN